jgi:hypothetical protein
LWYQLWYALWYGSRLAACSVASGQNPGEVADQGEVHGDGGALALPGGVGENSLAFLARHQREYWGAASPRTLARTGPRSSDKHGPEIRGVTEVLGISPCILLPEGLRNVILAILSVALLRHA